MKFNLKLQSSLLGLLFAASPLTIQPAISATPYNPLFQNPLIWLGQPSPLPPPSDPLIYSFTPLAELPGFSQPLFGWMNSFNFESCVLGMTPNVGPYGTATTNLNATGCDGLNNSTTTQQPTGNADAAVAGSTGGLSTAAAVTTAVVVGGAIAIAVSGGGDGTTGTTGTTGTR